MDPASHPQRSLPDLILVNPSAGRGRAKRAVHPLRVFLRKAGWSAELLETMNAVDLANQARSAAVQGRKRILVLGGDGTFQILLNALGAYSDVTLGVIPGGGGDDLAKALGLPRDPVKAAAMLGTGETRLIDAVRVRTASGEVRLYAGGGGVGLDAEASFLAVTLFGNWPGRSRYIAAALRALASFRSLEVRTKLYSKQWEGARALEKRVLVLGILNTPSYGAGLRIAPDAQTDDGVLNLVALEHLSALEILKILPKLILSGELRTDRVQRIPIERACIETSRPARYHGDGEILGMTPLEVEVVPQSIRVLAPKRANGNS